MDKVVHKVKALGHQKVSNGVFSSYVCYDPNNRLLTWIVFEKLLPKCLNHFLNNLSTVIVAFQWKYLKVKI